MLLATLLALAMIGICIGLYLLNVLAITYGTYRLYRKRPPRRDRGGVSIIKPLVGVDENLEWNLDSFFHLDYPLYELLFCFNDDQDPALDIVQRLMARYKNIDVRLFFGGEEVGLNPKINNMMPAYRSAKYSMILISDAGIYMRSDALDDMVAAMDEDVALVTQTPYCMNRQGFAAKLEQVYFGTGHARIYLVGNCLRFVCSTGMSSLMRKTALESVGGMAKFGAYLAEDYFFGVAFNRSGWRCAISSLPALQNTALTDVSRFHERICRWMKLRVAMLPHTIILEPMQDCLLSGVLTAIAIHHLRLCCPMLFFVLHLFIWMTLDYTLIGVLQGCALPFGYCEFATLWLYRELSAFPTYLRALLEPDIRWRAGTFRLNWGGHIRIVGQKSSNS